MSDKDKEIQELKERLNKLENSEKSEYDALKDQEYEKLKKENKSGCLTNIFILALVFGLLFWFVSDDSDSSIKEESAEEVKQEAPKVDIAKKNREQIITSLVGQDFTAYWGQDTSLWIENPGYSKAELERFGYRFCDVTKNAGMNQSYIITFWQSLRNGPSGQILKVNCF